MEILVMNFFNFRYDEHMIFQLQNYLQSFLIIIYFEKM